MLTVFLYIKTKVHGLEALKLTQVKLHVPDYQLVYWRGNVTDYLFLEFTDLTLSKNGKPSSSADL